jgi:hypothetical protein
VLALSLPCCFRLDLDIQNRLLTLLGLEPLFLLRNVFLLGLVGTATEDKVRQKRAEEVGERKFVIDVGVSTAKQRSDV